MGKSYNSVGSLTAIKTHLMRHNIQEFNSLNEIITFQKNYFSLRKEVISHHKILIEEERAMLFSDMLGLDNAIIERKIEVEKELRLEIDNLKNQLNALTLASKNKIKRFINFFRKHFIRNNIRTKDLNFGSRISCSIQHLENEYNLKDSRYQYIVSHFMEAVSLSSKESLKELERKKLLIDEINNYIYGAIGEQKVVKEVENLPDGYFLINDFSIMLPHPIYNKHEKSYIISIQIDHILISPSGIFLIETKNWSAQSLNNLSLRSPVEQIKRCNFAFFILLNEGITCGNLNLNQHHWGDRKIPVRNLIVLTNVKPNEEFQYVKVLTLNELVSYIKYFKPSFSNNETKEITNYLLTLQKNYSKV